MICKSNHFLTQHRSCLHVYVVTIDAPFLALDGSMGFSWWDPKLKMLLARTATVDYPKNRNNKVFKFYVHKTLNISMLEGGKRVAPTSRFGARGPGGGMWRDQALPVFKIRAGILNL